MALRRRSVRFAAFVLGGTLGLLSLAAASWGSPQAERAAKKLSFYTTAIGVQYINTEDDRARGATNNPFDAATNKLAPEGGDTGSEPFPGDVAVYAFDLHASPTGKNKLGTASYTCYFNYTHHALCEAYFELAGGTVVASGPVDFEKSGFDLVVTGGTKGYLATHGALTAVPAAQGTQRVQIDLSGSSAGGRKSGTTYAVPSTAQFLNHADDRLRGMSTNPFNVKAAGLVFVTQGKEKGNGPFAGDDVLYTFKLYTSPKLDQQTGTTTFTCYYDFAKHATCDAYLEQADGVLLASGPVAFGATHFTLSISGGTGAYDGASGEIVATPGAKAERLQVHVTR